MNKDLTIGQRLERLVYNADLLFTWWRLEQESENLYRFIGVTPETKDDVADVLIVEEEDLLALLARTRREGLEEPIPPRGLSPDAPTDPSP